MYFEQYISITNIYKLKTFFNKNICEISVVRFVLHLPKFESKYNVFECLENLLYHVLLYYYSHLHDMLKIDRYNIHT